MRLYLIPILFLLFGLPVRGDVAKIVEQSARQRIADLQAYIESQPTAVDLGDAYAALVEDYHRLEEFRLAFEAQQAAYDWVVGRPEIGLDVVFGVYVQPVAEAMAKAGERKMGRTFLLKVRKDFRAHPFYPKIAVILDELDKLFLGIGVGDRPEITLVDVYGRTIRLSDYRGKVVLVDFWSYTESANLPLISGLQAAYDVYKDEGFEIFSLSEDNSITGLNSYLSEAEMPWIHALDKKLDNGIAEQLGITQTPNNFLFNQQGEIVGKNVYDKRLMREVGRLLKKKTGE